MELLRYWYRYGLKFCFAGLLVFATSTFVGYNIAQIAKDDFLDRIEVKIAFGKNLMTMDFVLSEPMINIPWETISEENFDAISTDKTRRTYVTMATEDVQYDLRLLNYALDNLRASHVTHTQSRDKMTWDNQPRNFQTLDIAKGEHARYMKTIVSHMNVVTLLYKSEFLGQSSTTPVQNLKNPVKEYYQWTTRPKMCRDMKDNIQRFKYIEETCWTHVGLNKSLEQLEAIENNLILNSQMLKNYPLFIHLIDQGLVDSLGNVYTGSLLMIPLGCNQRLPFSAATDWKMYAEKEIEREVFVMTQFYDNDPSGFMIDSLPRVVPFLKFLWSHRQIKIHVLEPPSTARGHRTLEMLNILGIDKARIISGHVKSELIYVPQGGGCKTPNSLQIQTLAQLFHQHIKETLHIRDTYRNTILLMNSDNYKIHDFGTVVSYALEFAEKCSMEVKILSDKESQELSLAETMASFYKAAIIVGSPGPLMSNILFCQPGTVVIQTLCSPPYLTLGHLNVAYSLGLRYHAIPGNIGCSSGIVLDMPYVKDVLGFYTNHFNMVHS